MAINFPSSPTNGQTLTVGNVVYTWSSAKGAWSASLISTTARSNNRIVNPSMISSQENGNTIGTGVYFPADQFAMSPSIAPGGVNIQRVQLLTPRGSRDRLRITITTANASLAVGSYLGFVMYIEGNFVADLAYATSYAAQAILRFGFKGPAGTYHATYRTASRSYPAPFTISAGQANTDTEQTIFISPDAGGTWAFDNTIHTIWITLAAGTSFNTGTANAWNASGTPIASPSQSNGAAALNTFELFDVGFYVDPDYTGRAPDWVQDDQLTATMQSQRYWYKFMGGAGLFSATTSAVRVGMPHPVSMRIANPTTSWTGSPTVHDGTTTRAISAVANGYHNILMSDFNFTTAAAAAAGRAGILVGAALSYMPVSAR